MADFQPDTQKMKAYAIGGALVVGVVLFLIVLVAGAEWYFALLVGVFLGLFVGSGLGFLVGGRVDQVTSDDEG